MKKFLLVCFSFVFVLSTAWAQERNISGKVTSSEDGAALPGVNVVLKGTTNGTVTDVDGNFKLSVPGDGGTLVISFIGMQTLEVSIGDRSIIDAKLQSDVTELQEVVVTGYGTMERRKMSTAVSTVNGTAVAQLATPNFVDQLGGRAAGVQVGVNTGMIGQSAAIKIRGTNSLTQGTTPLFVIDGIPMNNTDISGIIATDPMSNINPNDIESYDILKDGAATAIYGSRAANGVVLITTKRGTKFKGKQSVDFSVTTGVSDPVKYFDLANASEFETIANKKLENAGLGAAAFSDPAVSTSGKTDWQKTILRSGKFQNYNVAMSGNMEHTNYYFSVGYQNQESNVKTNGMERFSVRTTADHRVNKFFKLGATINYNRTETTGLNAGTNALSGNIAGGLRAFPNVTVTDPTNPTGYNLTSDGQALGSGANTRTITSSWTNQGFVLANNKFINTSDRLIGQTYAQVDIIDGLSIKSLIGIDYNGVKDFLKYDPRHGDGRGSNGLIINTFNTQTLWNWQNTLSYNKEFGAHGIDFVAGLEYQKVVRENLTGQGTSFSDRFFMEHGLITGTYANQFSGGTYIPQSFQSTFGRINYSYKERYLLMASVRRDGISQLDPNNRYGTFYGFSAGYRISQEDFYKNSGIANVMNELKIRGSYATVGNTDIGSFPYASLYGSAKYGSQNGVAFSQAGNPALQWETSKKTDIGADMGFLGNKLTLNVDWFRNDIDGNILLVPYPPSLGIPGTGTNQNTIAQNVGVLRNTGLEFTLGAAVMKRGDFQWNINANFTSLSTEVIKTFANPDGTNAEVGVGNYQIQAKVGQQPFVFYGYTYAGVNQANGYPTYVKGNGAIVQRNVANGNYSIVDPNNPTSETNTTGAALNPADVSKGGDRKVLGNSNPTWYGGLTNTFNYKGISLEIFIRYQGGNKVYNQTRQDVLLNQDFTNSGRELLNSWTPENPTSSLPKMYINNNSQVNQSGLATTRFLEDASFLRIQNIVLGYSLPKSLLQKSGTFKFTNIRVFAQVQNAFIFTNYKGVDPEMGFQGIDNNVNPLNRTYTFGLTIGL